MDVDELLNRFAYHPPKDEAAKMAHEIVRATVGTLAVSLNDLLPESREKSLALTALQEVMMWSNAAIAIHS